MVVWLTWFEDKDDTSYPCCLVEIAPIKKAPSFIAQIVVNCLADFLIKCHDVWVRRVSPRRASLPSASLAAPVGKFGRISCMQPVVMFLFAAFITLSLCAHLLV